jgi:hypothetical protein
MLRYIWIASHFHNQLRIELFKDTLQSIENQTIKPDHVILSFSLQEDLNHLKSDILDFKMYLSIPFTILYQPTRLYQFEHLYKIFQHVENDDNVFISFCDDDDFLEDTFIEDTNVPISQGYQKIHCKFYKIREDTRYANRHHNKSIGKYSEFGGLTCSLGYYKNFMESSFYKPFDCHCDILFSVYPEEKSTKLDKPLYYYRQGLFIAHYKIWMFPKNITECHEYKQILEDTKHLKTYDRNHVLSIWLYDKKDGKYILDNSKYIEHTLLQHDKEMKMFYNKSSPKYR